ncbi:hypothetical protein Glove_172g63 [Diversispora epigaea]|uniref:Uncharacterized protein n=1 Tax=Diversispora epigaea TaxID=1348612 RepID=A0A397ISN2_9GLOM|nr:hypothetical protein Glove_172g63 [Diversispora epigaea]
MGAASDIQISNFWTHDTKVYYVKSSHCLLYRHLHRFLTLSKTYLSTSSAIKYKDKVSDKLDSSSTIKEEDQVSGKLNEFLKKRKEVVSFVTFILSSEGHLNSPRTKRSRCMSS